MLGLLVLTHNDIKHTMHGSMLESSFAVTKWSCGFKISHKTSDKRKWLDVGAPGTYFTLERWSNEVMKGMAWDVSHVSCNPQRKYPRSHAGNGIRYPRTIRTGVETWENGIFPLCKRSQKSGSRHVWVGLILFVLLQDWSHRDSISGETRQRSIQSFGLPKSILWVQNHQDQ